MLFQMKQRIIFVFLEYQISRVLSLSRLLEPLKLIGFNKRLLDLLVSHVSLEPSLPSLSRIFGVYQLAGSKSKY